MLTASIFLLLGVLLSNVAAQDKKTVKANLKEATVFLKGAELTHTVSFSVNKGENEIYIEGLSNEK